MNLVKPIKPAFQPFSIEITTVEQATLMFALFNFVPVANKGVDHNLDGLSEQISKTCPGVLDSYDKIHRWLSSHWKYD